MSATEGCWNALVSKPNIFIHGDRETLVVLPAPSPMQVLYLARPTKHSIHSQTNQMTWIQESIQLKSRPRGFHLITHEVESGLPALDGISVGVLHLFLQHTSAALSINENADPDVPHDLENSISAIAPEGFPYRHTCEGPDDMPAHVKSSLLGCSLTIPISRGKLTLGTWQGIYLCEHRNHGGRRRLVATIWVESN